MVIVRVVESTLRGGKLLLAQSNQPPGRALRIASFRNLRAAEKACSRALGLGVQAAPFFDEGSRKFAVEVIP